MILEQRRIAVAGAKRRSNRHDIESIGLGRELFGAASRYVGIQDYNQDKICEIAALAIDTLDCVAEAGSVG